VRAEALALCDSGLGAMAISRRLGIPYGTVKSWVQPSRRRCAYLVSSDGDYLVSSEQAGEQQLRLL
jgi:transposase-like protein